MKFDLVMRVRVSITVALFALSLWVWWGQKLDYQQDIQNATNAEDLRIAEGMLDVHMMMWPFVVMLPVMFWLFGTALGVFMRWYIQTTYDPSAE